MFEPLHVHGSGRDGRPASPTRTYAGRDDVEEAADDGERQRHAGDGVVQRAVLLLDLHHRVAAVLKLLQVHYLHTRLLVGACGRRRQGVRGGGVISGGGSAGGGGRVCGCVGVGR